MSIHWNFVFIILAYLMGSIPTAVWVGRIFYKIDIREHGSGNAGATNTLRVLGPKAGIPVLIIDILKGFFAVKLAYLTQHYTPGSNDFVTFQLMLGIASLLGHIFPLYAEFRGGKGVATLFGLVLAIDPLSTLVCAGIFLFILFLTRYVSLSSMIAGFAFPIAVILIFKTTTVSLAIFSMTIAILLLFTHQKNIERLLKREESKVFSDRRKKED